LPVALGGWYDTREEIVMPLRLSEEQRQALAAQPDAPLRLLDEQTQTAYVLLRADEYDRLRGKPTVKETDSVIPPGIRRSKDAFLRELPALLANPKLDRWWVAYHGDERLGIARNKMDLVRECLRRGLKLEEYYIGIITPHESEPEEIERSLYEYDDEPSETPT
jgi:hypothetical protein